MIAFLPTFSSRSLRPVLGLLAFSAALALASTALAQTPPADKVDKDAKQLSDKVREGLGKFGAFQEAKDWNGALDLIAQLQKVSQTTFDEFELAYIKGQLYLSIDQAAKSIEPLETTLRLADEHHFFDDKEERKVIGFLSKAYYGRGDEKGITPAQQEQYFGKAADYLKRLLDSERTAHALNPDDFLFYAYLQYNRSQVNPDKVDFERLKDAQKLSEEGLTLTITPKVEFYKLLISILTVQGNYVGAAELIELQLVKDPSNKEYWTQLSALYSQLASNDVKDKQKGLEDNIRAILTIERAQALGQMKTPKDNFNLVGIYFNINQIEHAAKLLEAGLKNGTIEGDEQKWTYLAQWYQQLNQDQKSIEVVKEAAQHFPKSGDFDLMAAQSYYGLEKFDDALQEAKLAATKGLGENTWRAWSFAAYTAFELQKYDEALAAVTKALSFPDSKKDAQLPTFKETLEKIISDRNQQAEALKAKLQQ